MRAALDRDGFVRSLVRLDTERLERWRTEVGSIDTPVARGLIQRSRVRELAAASGLSDAAAELLGAANAFPVRGLYFDKSAGANWFVPWHQDTLIAVAERPACPAPGFGAWTRKAGADHVRPPAEVLERMVTLRIALDDAPDAESGALRVACGTHRRGILGDTALRAAVEGTEEEVLWQEAGDVLAMKPLLAHASSKSTSDSQRRVVHLEFAAEALPLPLSWRSGV